MNAVPSPDAGTVLRVRELCVRFTTEDGTVSAVDQVDLDVGAGEIVALVGESGCGKSVTAMSLAGLLPPTADVQGSIRLRETELRGAPERALRRLRGSDITYVFQEPMTSLNPVLTVGRQVSEVLEVHQRLRRSAARRRAVELLALVGIPSPERRIHEYPHQLSGGMRQRVVIAMAVACDPKLLVADEPTTALDVTVQAGILDVLRDLRDRLGTAVLLITHDLGVVADVCDRVVVMYAGRVVEQAPVHELFARPRHHYTSALLGAIPTGRGTGTSGGRRLREIPGLVPVLSDPPDRCTFADRCPRADELCRTSQPPLSGTPGHLVACWHPADQNPPEATR
ncbi:ABC transporter ATP-binding protein [Actinopolymorpha pittospori]|uniref:Peptide/nickel transport system ATP-binding protein n=1 Tax=Actinopolymorpha pittospori TaxID=648752 RepID=A0A927RNM0_9ACTN|nr:ABC transporter ATP-binding protein [Actinopolymorpha pittospori]MBE1611251.1 peptide/nickel transport system ATP-binding protein [Actinopolymorpha pittospori]